MKMMKFKVAGVSYYKDNILELADENDDYLLLSNRELIESYDVGDKIYQYEFNPKHVELIPDPENEYDKNAVRVEIDGLQVGHIKKGSCSQVKNLLASPDFLRVEVDSMGLGGYKRICEEYEEDEYDWYSEKGPKRKVYVEKGEYESCWVHILICMREPEDVNAPVVSPLESKSAPEKEKREKKLEKWHIIVIAAVLALAGALLIVYGVMPSESDTANTTDLAEPATSASTSAAPGSETNDLGAGEFNVSTGAGSTADGIIPVLLLDKNEETVLSQIGVSTVGVDGTKLSYIYIDGDLVGKKQMSDTDASVNAGQEQLTEGTHMVTLKQYDNDEESGTVVTEKTAQYKVEFH